MLDITLGDNEGILFDHTITIDPNAKSTSAYWLEEEGSPWDV